MKKLFVFFLSLSLGLSLFSQSNTSAHNIWITGELQFVKGRAVTKLQNQNVTAATITLPSATTTLPGLSLGNIWTGANTIPGGTSVVPLIIGEKSNTADKGLILVGSTDNTGGVQIFADDGGDAAAQITSPLWTRYLLTRATQTSGATQTGLYAQLKTYLSQSFTGGSITALKAYNQAGTVTLLSGAEYGIINAGMSLEGNMTNTSGMVTGIDVNINGGYTIGGASVNSSGITIRKVSGSTAVWPVGLYIPAGGTKVPIQIGIKSNTASAAHVLVGSTDNTGGVQIFCDDGGAAVSDVTSPIWTRYLVTAAQSGPTQTGLFAQLKTKDASTTFTNSSITALKAYNQAGVVVLAGASEFGIINAGTTLAGEMTIPTGTKFSGIDINIGGVGPVTVTGTGVAAGLIIRDKGEGAAWPVGLYIPSGGRVPIQIGVKSNTASVGHVLVGSTDNTGGVQIFCDDGGAAVSDVTSPIWTRYLVTAAQSGPTQTGLFAQLKTKDASTTFTNSSITALKAYNQAGVVVLAGTAEFGIINAGTTLAGAMTVPDGTQFSGVDINIGGVGPVTVSGTGKAAGLIIRNKGEGAAWTDDIILQNGDRITGNQGATLGGNNGTAAIVNYVSGRNQTIVTLDDYVMTITDHTTAGAHGTLKLIDFPEGLIQIDGVVGDLNVSAISGGVSTTAVYDIAIGSATTLIDAETLGNANVDIVAKVDGTLIASADDNDLVNTTLQLEDGHAASTDAWLCVAIENTSCSADGTITISGTIVITWENLGDY